MPQLVLRVIVRHLAKLGDAFVERANRTVYTDPMMKTFIDTATETVFGTLWARPGLDLKTRTLVCVVSDAATARTSDEIWNASLIGAPEDVRDQIRRFVEAGCMFFELNDNRAHGKDERIEVQDFYDGVEVSYRLIKNLSSKY